MPFKIIRQDITKMDCDAIVNPTNTRLSPGGGVDLAIHNAAGKELYECCKKIGECSVGQAVITPAFKLNCKYVIHTASPRWGLGVNLAKKLEMCYRNSLLLAYENGCESVVFPLIASGTCGFPKKLVLKCATRVISEFLVNHDMTVYLAVYDKNSYEISKKLFSSVKAYIDDNYIEEAVLYRARMMPSDASAGAERTRHDDFSLDAPEEREDLCETLFPCAQSPCEEPSPDCAPQMSQCASPAPDCAQAVTSAVRDNRQSDTLSLESMLKNLDKGFAQTLFYYIDKKGLTDVECYKKSNVDKKTFSKIKCNKDYKPSKITAVSFAIGLRLNLKEASHLLSTVGLCLSHSQKFDVIIEYFLKTGNYKDIFEVNEVLYSFDQTLLGV